MYFLLKRICDFMVAAVVLVVISPVMITTALILRFSGEGEIFYQQERIGFRNQSFNILKFATMIKDAPNMAGGTITLRNDPRVTPVGRVLRMTKLNELPQLLNILKGDMSIVGPRPMLPRGFKKYPRNVQQKIYDVRPGLTGIGSVVFRDEEKIVSSAPMPPEEVYVSFIFPYKGELELWYQKNQSFIVDLKLILLTAISIFAPHNRLVDTWFSEVPSWPEEYTALRIGEVNR